VTSSWNAVPPISLDHLGQRLPGGRDVDGDHVRAVARQNPRDRAPMPGRRPVTTATLPASGRCASSPGGTSAAVRATTWPST
jgi:hypothetical protein